MKLIFKALIVITFYTTSNHLLAQDQIEQDKSYQGATSKMYDYEFTGEINDSQLELLRSEVASMRFVTKVKIYYKSEKGSGQIRLFTEEHFIDWDTDFEFNIYNLKMLIAKFNLTPAEYRSEVISK